MTIQMTIDQWPLHDRPREKLLKHGAKHLTDAELVAIFIRTGLRGKTALDISRELITKSGSLKKLLGQSLDELLLVQGLGQTKYAMLQAAIELGRRYLEEELVIGETLGSSQATKRFFAQRLKDYPHEVFACLFLDTHHRMLGFEELFHGTLTEASIYPRELIKRCLAFNAAKIILAHNHPSGNPQPSLADKEITLQLKNTLAMVDTQLIDHIVVGHTENLSFAELGLI